MRAPSVWQAWWDKIWRSLSRLRLGVILLSLLLGAVAAGTFFPQLPEGADTTAWWEATRDRYGLLYGPLRTIGAFNLFETLWFQGLLGLLLLSTLACFLRRARPLSRVILRPRTQLPVERFERAVLRARLTFTSTQAAESALRAALRRRGYRVQVEQGGRSQQALHLRADRHRLPRLGTLLTHISLVCLLLGAVWGGLRGWRVPALAIGSERATAVGHGTDVGLRCDRFQIMRYDDGTPRDYRADIVLLNAQGDELARGTVRVNHPLRHAGVNYYLRGYRLNESEACDVTLSAVRNSGFGLLIAAGLGLLCGVTLTFHFPHRRVWARLEPTGETRLAGSTTWDKERFARQFEALVVELRARGQRGEQA